MELAQALIRSGTRFSHAVSTLFQLRGVLCGKSGVVWRRSAPIHDRQQGREDNTVQKEAGEPQPHDCSGTLLHSIMSPCTDVASERQTFEADRLDRLFGFHLTEARTSSIRAASSGGKGMRLNGLTFEPPVFPCGTRPTAVPVAAPTMRSS